MGNILDGEKIESLLWANGLDFEHSGSEDSYLHIYSGLEKVVVSSCYTGDGANWHLDADSVTLEIWHNGDLIDEYDETFEDEDALVQKVLTYVE